jgi:hypothetical protein
MAGVHYLVGLDSHRLAILKPSVLPRPNNFTLCVCHGAHEEDDVHIQTETTVRSLAV